MVCVGFGGSAGPGESRAKFYPQKGSAHDDFVTSETEAVFDESVHVVRRGMRKGMTS